MKFLNFLWVIFALLDPDLDSESGSESTVWLNPDPKHFRIATAAAGGLLIPAHTKTKAGIDTLTIVPLLSTDEEWGIIGFIFGCPGREGSLGLANCSMPRKRGKLGLASCSMPSNRRDGSLWLASCSMPRKRGKLGLASCNMPQKRGKFMASQL
jgi:hypothetical protein